MGQGIEVQVSKRKCQVTKLKSRSPRTWASVLDLDTCYLDLVTCCYLTSPAILTNVVKLSASNAAPPIKPPFTSGQAKSSFALSGLQLPP